MRITLLSPPDNLTGGLRVIALYASELQALGHHVLVVCTRHAQPTLREHLRAIRHRRWSAWRQELADRQAPGHLTIAGVPLRLLDHPGPIDADDVPDADVVIATWWETAVWMSQLPAAKGRQVHLIQGYELWCGGGDPVTQARVRDAMRMPNLKVAISTGLKHEIEDDLGPLGIQVVPNAVDRRQFNAPARGRNTAPTVGFVYSPDPIKAPDRCLKVIDRLRLRLPDVQVLAFGAQQPSPVAPLPAGTEFHHCPAQSALSQLYARCDAWLFATRVDSFGLPILEAMACRTPVVGVPVGAAPDLLADGTGLLVKACDDEDRLIESLTDALQHMLEQPESEWQTMAALAHDRAHARSWRDAVNQFASLLDRSTGADSRNLGNDRSCPSTASLPPLASHAPSLRPQASYPMRAPAT